MLKKTILASLISFQAFAGAQTASDLKFVTNFKGFTCKSYKDKVEAPVEFKELGVKLTNLGISDSTRVAIMDAQSDDGQCLYSAHFSRKKGEKILNFETSVTNNDSARCHELAADLDEIMKPGFRYVIKFNAYLALLFGYDLESVCDQSTGNNIAEFHWEI